MALFVRGPWVSCVGMNRTRNLLVSFAVLMAGTSCVNVDPNTGEIAPRGNQRYEFERVEKRAKRLKKGMSRYDTLILLGSPAEKSARGDVWIYLPERPAILVPSRALRIEFEDGRLLDWSYRPIVLGTRI